MQYLKVTAEYIVLGLVTVSCFFAPNIANAQSGENAPGEHDTMETQMSVGGICWPTDVPPIDVLEQRIRLFIDKQKYFTAINGGDFSGFKEELASNKKYLSIVIMETIYKSVNHRPLLKIQKNQNTIDPNQIMILGNPSCGQYAIVFQELGKRFDLPVRRIGTHQPGNTEFGHEFVEVWYDGAWHMFDPTFFGFYTKDGTVDSNVVSLNDILDNPFIVNEGAVYAPSMGLFQHSYYMWKNFYPESVLKDLGIESMDNWPRGIFTSARTYRDNPQYYIDGKPVENIPNAPPPGFSEND